MCNGVKATIDAQLGGPDQRGETHYYHDNQRVIELRNGSDKAVKHLTWGLMYVDELVQVAAAKSIIADPDYRSWAWYFYPLHNANFNVMLVVDRDGRTTERYEYTPYGERTVYSHGWHLADITRDGKVSLLDLNAIGTLGQTSPKDEE